MTKAEILQALTKMSLDDRLEIAETALNLIRQDRTQREHRRQQMAEAASSVISDYLPGGDLASVWTQGDPDYTLNHDEISNVTA